MNRILLTMHHALPSLQEIIDTLQLQPHPEGGFFREMHRSTYHVIHPSPGPSAQSHRSAATAIYFLLPVGTFSAFHRVRSDETWHLYLGGPVELHVITPDGAASCIRLGHNLAAGERPQVTLPAMTWQAARCITGAAPYALCGCTVAPGFDFADFEMPPTDQMLAMFPQHEAIVRELSRP